MSPTNNIHTQNHKQPIPHPISAHVVFTMDADNTWSANLNRAQQRSSRCQRRHTALLVLLSFSLPQKRPPHHPRIILLLSLLAIFVYYVYNGAWSKCKANKKHDKGAPARLCRNVHFAFNRRRIRRQQQRQQLPLPSYMYTLQVA